MPVSGLSAPPLPALEQSNDALAAVKLDNPTGARRCWKRRSVHDRSATAIDATTERSDAGTAGTATAGRAALDKTMPGTRIPQRSKPPLAPTPPKMESSTRDQGISLLLSPGPMRAQVQEVERLIQSTQFVQAVRRSMSIFFRCKSVTPRAIPDQKVRRGELALGLPADRYLRFRQVGQSADASRSTVEDAMFALFSGRCGDAQRVHRPTRKLIPPSEEPLVRPALKVC